MIQLLVRRACLAMSFAVVAVAAAPAGVASDTSILPTQGKSETSEGPSLEETETWLVEQLSLAGLHETGWHRGKTVVDSEVTLRQPRFVDCRLSFDIHESGDGTMQTLDGPYLWTGFVSSRDSYEIKLYEILTVSLFPAFARHGGTVRNAAVNITVYGPSGFARTSGETPQIVSIPFENSDLAGRIVKALSHEAKLCAARKKSPF